MDKYSKYFSSVLHKDKNRISIEKALNLYQIIITRSGGYENQ
jgi:hypothetical protein